MTQASTIVPTYRGLKPVLRRFVDGHLAGHKGVELIRRLRPEAKRPDVVASKWLARPDVKAAIAERADAPLELSQLLSLIERRLAAIELHLAELRLRDPPSPVNQQNRSGAPQRHGDAEDSSSQT